MNPESPHNQAPVIGIDLGGTNMLLGIIAPDHTIIARHHVPTESENGFEHVLGNLLNGIDDLCSQGNTDLKHIGAIGLAVAGAVDIERGVVLDAHNLKWLNLPLRDILQEKTSRRIVLDNDVNAATWGEYRAGAGKERGDQFAVWVGTGIGGGIILNGALYHGAFSTAGEFGLTISTPDGEVGFRTIEEHASRTGYRQALSTLMPAHPDSLLNELTGGDALRIGTKELAEAYHAGDELTCNVIDRGAQLLGTSIANFVTFLSVETVIMGGGLTESLGERYLDVIRKSFQNDVFPERCRECQILRTKLESDAGLLGAGLLAMES